jgi:hypothetical protein
MHVFEVSYTWADAPDDPTEIDADPKFGHGVAKVAAENFGDAEKKAIERLSGPGKNISIISIKRLEEVII